MNTFQLNLNIFDLEFDFKKQSSSFQSNFKIQNTKFAVLDSEKHLGPEDNINCCKMEALVTWRPLPDRLVNLTTQVNSYWKFNFHLVSSSVVWSAGFWFSYFFSHSTGAHPITQILLHDVFKVVNEIHITLESTIGCWHRY